MFAPAHHCFCIPDSANPDDVDEWMELVLFAGPELLNVDLPSNEHRLFTVPASTSRCCHDLIGKSPVYANLMLRRGA
jgi:hypothetical protein